MKKTAIFLVVLIAFSAAAEAIVLLQVHLAPYKLAAVLLSFSLILSAFVGLSQPSLVRYLRQRAAESVWAAAGLPFLLLVPYFVYAFGTGSFRWLGVGKLLACIAVPVLLLLPDRLHRPARLGWRDAAAMLALGLPVATHWLQGIWTWPHDLYFFRPVFGVCIGVYAFAVLRNLDGVGYRLLWRKQDLVDGFANALAFCLLAIPVGLVLHFLHPHSSLTSLGVLPLQFAGIYLTIAIPEELLFRGILQNLLCRSIKGTHASLYGLIIASVIFGASHLYHMPAPNWRYAAMAAMAGIFYGNTFRTRQRLSASALAHALVNTVWHFWF